MNNVFYILINKIIILFGLSLASMALASMLLGVLMSGSFWFLVGFPFLMGFGWFYFPVILILHFIAWWACPVFAKKLTTKKFWFAATGGVVGAILFGIIGIKITDAPIRSFVSYAISAFIAGSASCWIISKHIPRTVKK